MQAGTIATNEIIEHIRKDPRIPAPSQSVCKILELTRNYDCRLEDVAAIIGRDSGLTAQILRMTNSALYCYSNPTSSVGQACVRLGLRSIRAAVINQHVVSGLGKTRPPSFDAKRYWQGTLAASVAAHDLAGELVPDAADEAGTAGLLCDIGMGLMAFGIPGQYQHVLAQACPLPCQDLERIERRILGITHPEVGAAILADWKLDPPIIEAVRAHHADPLTLAYRQLPKTAQIVVAGMTLATMALCGSDMNLVAKLFTAMETLTPRADALVDRLLDRLVENIQHTAAAYAVEIGSIEDLQANVEDARQHLPEACGHDGGRPRTPGGAGG